MFCCTDMNRSKSPAPPVVSIISMLLIDLLLVLGYLLFALPFFIFFLFNISLEVKDLYSLIASILVYTFQMFLNNSLFALNLFCFCFYYEKEQFCFVKFFLTSYRTFRLSLFEWLFGASPWHVGPVGQIGTGAFET